MSDPRILASQRRENPEPEERARPVPWYMLALTAGLFAFGVVYILRADLDGPSALGDIRTAQELRGKAPAAAGGGGAVDGAALYASLCAACHQATGQGLPGVFPPLAGTPSIVGAERRLAAIVLHGVTGSLTVGGTVYNGAMPAFGAQLSDAEIAAVLTHVRSQWGNAAPAVPADTVMQVRGETASQASPYNGDADLAAFQ
jgi:mono/diheme cytochrome c family protein